MTAITLDLPPNVIDIFKVYAATLDDTLENVLTRWLEDATENLKDGEVLDQEVREGYYELFPEKKEEANSD